MFEHFASLTLVALDQGGMEGGTLHTTPKIAFACEGYFWAIDFCSIYKNIFIKIKGQIFGCLRQPKNLIGFGGFAPKPP
jgi:hypothetical protein